MEKKTAPVASRRRQTRDRIHANMIAKCDLRQKGLQQTPKGPELPSADLDSASSTQHASFSLYPDRFDEFQRLLELNGTNRNRARAGRGCIVEPRSVRAGAGVFLTLTLTAQRKV